MCTLSNFPPLPGDEQIPLCEVDGRVQYSSPEFMNLHLYTSSVSQHPNVVLTKDVLHHSTPRVFTGPVFLPGSDNIIHSIQDAWYENGTKKVLEILSEREDLFKFFRIIAKHLLSGYVLCEKSLRHILFQGREEALLEDCKNSDPVVYMNWHPECTKLAVVTRDDTVTLFSANTSLHPVLKAKPQRRIKCIAWRPLTSGELAVACSEGVYVWNVDPTTFVTRPAFSSAVHLPVSYVSNITWSPQGDILMVCNSKASWLLAWEVDTKKTVYIKRGGVGGIHLLSWSPDGSKLVTSSSDKYLRIWNTAKWTCEWWKIGGVVSSSCWSQNGAVLLFTTNSEPYLYSLSSTSTVFSNEKRPLVYVMADLTRVQVPSGQIVGGDVRRMEWDRSNRRLALIFKDSPLIAIFYTRLRPQLQVSMGFYIRGLPNEIPSFICYQNNFTEGANLTICWSNGRVQYFPMIYRDSQVTPRSMSQTMNTFSPNISALGECSPYYYSPTS